MEIGHYTSATISIVSGVVVAVLIELILLARYRLKRRSEIAYIRQFFIECESEIKIARGTEDGRVSRSAVQFVLHQHHLRTAELMLVTRSNHLSNTQSFEVIKFINEQIDFANMISAAAKGSVPEEKFYDQFSAKLREIKWLKI